MDEEYLRLFSQMDLLFMNKEFDEREFILKREIRSWTSYMDTYICIGDKKDPGEIFIKRFPVNKNITIRCRI